VDSKKKGGRRFVLPMRRRQGDVERVTPARFLLFFALAAAAPAAAQPQSLGVFSTWAAFRDAARCYAITQPYGAGAAQEWRPFASIGHWPARGGGGQLHIRLSRQKREGSAVLIRIDGRSFQLVGGGRDAWAPDARADVEIQAAMRNGIELAVETRSTDGRLVRDLYRLRGAATAMDAAAIACARRR